MTKDQAHGYPKPTCTFTGIRIDFSNDVPKSLFGYVGVVNQEVLRKANVGPKYCECQGKAGKIVLMRLKIVKTLHTIVLQGKGRGRILDLLVNTITKNGSLSILFGMLLTISVQSSSITTSTLTPLVGLSIISLEQMLPLTLGANLGTTCTAFMASLVTESKNSVQIAVCHFIFNATGVTIFYPIQKVRQLPIEGAKRLGKLVTHYKWFSVFYTSYVFVIVPLILFGISFLFNGNVLPSILGTIFIGMLGYTSHMGLTRLEQLQSKKIESNINRIIVE